MNKYCNATINNVPPPSVPFPESQQWVLNYLQQQSLVTRPTISSNQNVLARVFVDQLMLHNVTFFGSIEQGVNDISQILHQGTNFLSSVAAIAELFNISVQIVFGDIQQVIVIHPINTPQTIKILTIAAANSKYSSIGDFEDVSQQQLPVKMTRGISLIEKILHAPSTAEIESLKKLLLEGGF